MSNYKVISLFAGAGGSSVGYEMAGFDVIAAVEFVDFQVENYRLNHPNTIVFAEDIRKLNPKNVLRKFNLRKGELDVLDGSPPCDSFSMAGKREKKWREEKKYQNKIQRTDDLFEEYLRFLNELKPKIFLAENVPGLIYGKAKGYFNFILRKMRENGYNVKCKILNAKNYEVPQSRCRLFFMGVRNDLNMNPVFPKRKEVIPTIERAWKNLIDDGCFRRLNKKSKIYKLWINSRPGERFERANELLYNKNGLFGSMKIDRSIVCPTVTGSASLFYDKDPRTLSIAELKRITTFPDDYKLKGSFQRKWIACGMAVPPMLIKNIAETIKDEILDKI